MAIGTVILVPGITGSTVRYPGILGALGDVWMNPTRLIVGGFQAMRLPVPSETDRGPSVQASVGGPALAFYYGALALSLIREGWRVVWPLADWRKPMSLDAGLLAGLIRIEAANGPVRVLCHSRGGLITRLALASLDASGKRDAVSRVVGLGVPHTGSLHACAYVSGDSSTVKLTRQLAAIFPGKLVTTFLVKTITGVTRSWPALYELMPPPGAPWLPAAQTAAFYQMATWQPSATVPVEAYLIAAQANWSALPAVPSWVDWIDVAGVGIPTPGSIPSLEALALEGELTYDADGDGTVPIASAAQSPRKRITVPTGHSSLPLDPRVWALAHNALLNGAPADIALGGKILNI